MRDIARSDEARSLWDLVLGLRFLVLAAITGAAAFLPRGRVDPLWLVIGILTAVASALLQHVLAPRMRRGAAVFVLTHAAAWTLLIHATGGQGSPLALGYLLELPLSGALLSRRGVIGSALASLLFYLGYACTIGSPLRPTAAVLLVALVAVCALISWRLVAMLERQRIGHEASRMALTSRSNALAEELRRLGDSLDDALVTIDEGGRIASVNPSGIALLGVDLVTAIGRPWQEVLNPDRTSCARLSEVLASGTAQRGVTMVLSPRPPATVTARAAMWTGTSRDGARTHLLLDLSPVEAADDPVRRLGESAACVAHQIKNSMHALQGLAVGRDLMESADRETGDPCVAALSSLGSLAEDVLAMAGASARPRERIPIQDILKSAIVLLGQPPIRLSAPSSPLFVEGRRGALVHAVFNLLDNAVRNSPPGSAVMVNVKDPDGLVVVDIEDDGPGLPAGFATARNGLPSSTGSGFGLMAARRFVEECGGSLSLAAALPHGTRCRVELPRAACAAVSTAVR